MSSKPEPCVLCGKATVAAIEFPYLSPKNDMRVRYFAPDEPWPAWMLDPQAIDPAFLAAYQTLRLANCGQHDLSDLVMHARTLLREKYGVAC